MVLGPLGLRYVILEISEFSEISEVQYSARETQPLLEGGSFEEVPVEYVFMCGCASWRYVEIQNLCDWDALKPQKSRNHWHETIIHHHPPVDERNLCHKHGVVHVTQLNRSWGSPMELRRHHFFPVYLKFYQRDDSDTMIPMFSQKSNSRELLCGILTQGTLHLNKWWVSKLPLSYPWSANHRIAGLHWRRRGRGRTVDDSRSWFVAWGNVENWRCFAD